MVGLKLLSKLYLHTSIQHLKSKKINALLLFPQTATFFPVFLGVEVYCGYLWFLSRKDLYVTSDRFTLGAIKLHCMVTERARGDREGRKQAGEALTGLILSVLPKQRCPSNEIQMNTSTRTMTTASRALLVTDSRAAQRWTNIKLDSVQL